MPFASNTTTASGSSDTVAVPFPYLDQSHVHVTVNGVQVADADLVFTSPSVIQLPSTPTAGQSIVVYRQTPATTLMAQAVDGAFIDDADFNEVLTQLLYVDQENADAAASAVAITSTLSDVATTASTAAASASADAATATAAAASASASAVLAASFSGASVAPEDADYLVHTSNAALSAERVVTDGTFISWVWGVAGQVSAIIVDGSITLAKMASACFATQAEAEAGTENTKVMTALRVFEAIAAYLVTNPAGAPPTGSLRPTHATTAQSGWILWDDGTIGDASSNATSRANADTSNLFTLYYGYSDALCPLFTSAGASTTRAAQGTASAAFAAHCAVKMPLGKGRFPGVVGTGSGLTARTLGAIVGGETKTLATGNLPAHTHQLYRYGSGSTTEPSGFNVAVNTDPDTGAQNIPFGVQSGPGLGAVAGDAKVISNTGSGTAFDVMNPATYTNWEIKL